LGCVVRGFGFDLGELRLEPARLDQQLGLGVGVGEGVGVG